VTRIVKRRTVIYACLIAGALAIGVAVAAAKTTITMSGSTSVAPLARALATKYVGVTRHTVGFRIAEGQSDIGINDVAHGRVTIGDSSRDPLPSDPHGLVFTPVARDAVCVITHPSNSIAGLSQAQIQSIFSGQVRNWSDIPGAHVSGPIDLVTRSGASGTADAFQNIFLGPSLHPATSAQQKSSNGLVQNTVAHDKSAIGYVSLDFVNGVHPVAYKGVACSLRNAKSGTYGGTRNFYMVTRGAPAGPAKKFIKWVRSNAAARAIVSTHWVPLH
jgi:phosphate transport system substrate-binding protein